MSRRFVLALVGVLGLGGCSAPARATHPPEPPRPPAPTAEQARSAETRLAEQTEAQEATPEPASEERRAEFVQRALAALRAAGETRAIQYDAEHFLFTIGELEPSTLLLTDFFDEYLDASPEEREDVLRRLVSARTAPGVPDAFLVARPKLVPVVRGRAFYEQVWLLMGKDSPAQTTVSFQAVGGHLAVGVALDGAETLRYLGPEEFARWGVSFRQVLDIALENLRQRSREPLEQLAPGTCRAPWKDSYAASRLLLDEVVRRCQVKGDRVVLAPHRDVLLITGSEDEEGLSLVAQLALKAVLTPRSLDGRALRWTSRGWVPFMPERLNGAWADFRKLQLFTQARDYDEQTRQLEKRDRETGAERFVAAFTPYQDERGHSLSYAVWQKGLTTVLPRTEVIFFMDPARGEGARPLAVARWDEVVKASGALLTPVPGLYPERYLTRDYPTEAQLAGWQNDPGDLFQDDAP